MTEKELKKASREDLLKILIEEAKEMNQLSDALKEKTKSLEIYMDLVEKLQSDLEKKDEELEKAEEKIKQKEIRIEKLTDVLMIEYKVAKGM